MENIKIISEHFKTADTTVEVVELLMGNIWVMHSDGEAILFDSLENLIKYESGKSVPRKYCDETELMDIYEENTSWGSVPKTIVD